MKHRTRLTYLLFPPIKLHQHYELDQCLKYKLDEKDSLLFIVQFLGKKFVMPILLIFTGLAWLSFLSTIYGK
jgi:hypothetical protein